MASKTASFKAMEEKPKRVCVVVLGDLGRSPRMQYHSLSLSQSGFEVDIVCYGGSEPLRKVVEDEKINIIPMSEPPMFSPAIPNFITYGLKFFWQCFQLMWTLLSIVRPDHILVQVPPSVPTLGVVWFYCLCYSTDFIIDWHNYGHTILQITAGERSLFVRFYKWFESYFGQKGSKHLCVTKAMEADLMQRIGIVAVPLYDRSPEQFHNYDKLEIHELFTTLSRSYKCFSNRCGSIGENDFTAFTEKGVVLKKDRPALIVSSTSWTEDEDIGLLFAALEAYDQLKSANLKNSKDFPEIVCAITGKGPLKEYFENAVSRMEFSHVSFCFPWLTAEDYPKLLSAADVGVSLHASSSGLDLPMKVVDMFGCGLPVLALKFECLNELVIDGQNGFVFSTASELAVKLQDLLYGFPDNSQLKFLREKVKLFQEEKWEDNWVKYAEPLFL